MKKLIVMLIMLIPLMQLHSQIKVKDNLLGGSIGLLSNGTTPILGVNFESHVAGSEIGTLSIGGVFRFHSNNVNYNNGDSRNYNFTSFGFQTNYNFTKIGEGSFVPFVGLVLGYDNVGNTYTYANNHTIVIQDNAYSSGLWIWGQVGAKYFISNSIDISGRVGLGNNQFYPVEIGMDFKL